MSLIVNNMIVNNMIVNMFFSREANEGASFRQRQGKESSCSGAEEAGHWSVVSDERPENAGFGGRCRKIL